MVMLFAHCKLQLATSTRLPICIRCNITRELYSKRCDLRASGWEIENHVCDVFGAWRMERFKLIRI